MSTQPFGAAPPPETPAPEPETAAKRSPLLLFGAPALAALLVAGGVAYVLLGGSSDDEPATGVPPAAPAPADPTPSPDPSEEGLPAQPVSSARNPFDPLVREPAGAPGTGAPGTRTGTGGGGGLTGFGPSDLPPITSVGSGTGSGSGSKSGSGSRKGPGSTGPGNGSGSGSGAGSGSGSGSGNNSGSGSGSGSGKGSGSGNGNGNGNGKGSGNGSGNGNGTVPVPPAPPAPPVPPVPPAPPALGSLDASATCKAGDELWTAYRAAMTDTSTTHTMAGHTIGPVTSSLDTLVGTTAVEELRQPLRTWARESASVRTRLVTGTSVRDVEPSTPLDTSTGGTPKPGTRPVVDQSAVLLARTAVRERCYQLVDPLVEKDSL